MKERPLLCVGALVLHEGTVLVVLTTKWTGLWGVPGGKVEYGETLEQAVCREFSEEVGLELHGCRQVQMQESINSPEFCKPAHMLLVDFIAHSSSTHITPNEEILEWAWVSPQQALSYPLNTPTKLLLERYIAGEL